MMTKKDGSSQEYFFGFGADCEEQMLTAIIGRKPEIVGPAVIRGFELCIQSLDDITDKGDNPRKILEDVWGPEFKSYVISPNADAELKGTLFIMTERERVMVDMWELVYEGWQKSVVVPAVLADGHVLNARTQVLAEGQSKGEVIRSQDYHPWVLPVEDLVTIARHDAQSYPERLATLGYE
jgi:hypothetical protein